VVTDVAKNINFVKLIFYKT